MFRIDSQHAPQPARAVTGSATAQPAPAPNSLEGLMKSLEEAIARLTQQQGGAQPGGGDRMEPARQPPTHDLSRHHHHRTFDREPPARLPPSTGPNTGPVIRLPPQVTLPDIPEQACGAMEGGEIVRKGLAGGTVGT